MIAVIMVKPVIVIVLGLAGALSAGDGPDAFSAVVSGLAIILLAIFASAMIYRFVPGFGDEIQGARTNRKQATDGAQAAALISSPAALVSQGIKTHSGRTEQGGGGGGGARPANPASGASPPTAPVPPEEAGRGRRRICPLRRTLAPQRVRTHIRDPPQQPPLPGRRLRQHR